jgi:hypothetical protein
MVWRRARVDFTFKGQSYRAGQVFAVPPIVAVQMRNRVDKAKAPQAEPEPEPAPKRRSRRAAALDVPPVPPVEVPAEVPTEPVAALPVAPTIDLADFEG